MKSPDSSVQRKEFSLAAKNCEVIIDNKGIVDEIKILMFFYLSSSLLLLIIFWKAKILLLFSTAVYALAITLRYLTLDKYIPQTIRFKAQSFDIVMKNNSTLNIAFSSIKKIIPAIISIKKTWFYIWLDSSKGPNKNNDLIIVNHDCGKELFQNEYDNNTNKDESKSLINNSTIFGWPSKVHDEIYIKLIKSKQIGLRVVIIQSAIVLLLLTISGYHYLVQNIDLFITFLSVASFVSILLIFSLISYRMVIINISRFPRHLYYTSSNNN